MAMAAPPEAHAVALDNTPPRSQVSALPSIETTSNVMLQWSGTDDDSGLQDFSVFVSEDGGAFSPFVTNTTSANRNFYRLVK